MTKILRIGHRGACGYAPENTLKSVQKALDLSCPMIEIDVFVCKSGEVVCFHDQKLKRMTGKRGLIVRKTLSELKEYDVGDGERIPTLKEVFDLVDKKAVINVELKGKKTLTPVLKLVREYIRLKGWKSDHFLISTMTRSKLKKVARLRGNIPMGTILAYRPRGFLKFSQKIGAYSLHINKNLVTKKRVEHAHKRGLKVYAWTANGPEDIEELVQCKVDGIFSDFPDRIKG